MKIKIQLFLIAMQFLTRLPIRFNTQPDKTSIAQSLGYYPLVGFFIGCLLTGIAWLLSDEPTVLVSSVLLTIWVLITGGLHIDGLADSADAWIGGFGDKAKTLTIMKDPYCGPAGVMSIVLVLLLKCAALHAILESKAFILILLAVVFGRTIPLLLFITTPYAREQGLGTAIASELSRKRICSICIGTLIAIVFVVGIKSIWLIATLLILFILSRRLMIQRIGGMTGDTAGALIEVTEVAILIAGVCTQST